MLMSLLTPSIVAVHSASAWVLAAKSESGFESVIGVIVLIILIVAANWPTNKPAPKPLPPQTPNRPASPQTRAVAPPPIEPASRRSAFADEDDAENEDDADGQDSGRSPMSMPASRPSWTTPNPAPVPRTAARPEFQGRSTPQAHTSLTGPKAANPMFSGDTLSSKVEARRSAEAASRPAATREGREGAQSRLNSVGGRDGEGPDAKARAAGMKISLANKGAQALIFAEVFGPPLALRDSENSGPLVEPPKF